MKIILSFFDKAYSKPMDVPESCGTRWDMVLMEPIQVGSMIEGVLSMPSLSAKCTFEWTGKWVEDVRLYRMVGISKL